MSISALRKFTESLEGKISRILFGANNINLFEKKKKQQLIWQISWL